MRGHRCAWAGSIAALSALLATGCSDEFSSDTDDADAGGRGPGVGGAAASAGSAGMAGSSSGGSGGVGGGVPGDDYALAVLDDSPAAYWRLNDAEDSSTAKDSAGSFDGTYTASVTHPVSGLLAIGNDGAAQFADSSSSRVDVGDVLDFAAGVAFSLELWVKPVANDEDFLVQKTTLSDEYGYVIRTTASGGAFQLRNANGVAGVPFPKLTLSAATHLVASYDGSLVCVYLNAKMEPCVQSVIQVEDTGAAFRIGQHFAGVIDEVAVYDRALTQTEISNHFELGSGQ